MFIGMSGYTKLFNSILASTIWRQDNATRIVWITLLAMSNRDGVAEGSVPGLADFARVSVRDARRALANLMAPDTDSRSKECEGRRIEEIDGGWRIINHAKYRAKMSADERREYNRVKQAEHRQRKSTNVKDVNDESALSAHTKADTKAVRTRTVAARRNAAENGKTQKPFVVIRKLAHDVFDAQGPFEDEGDFIEAVKTACARNHIGYDSRTARKAVESVLARR